MTNKPLLELNKVSKIYRTKGNIFGRGGKEVVALNQIDLTLNQGEIFGLVGESGSGKTTCGRLIVGLEKVDQGSITLEGNEISSLSSREFREYRSRIQMVFQDPYQSLNPQITILDSVSEPLVTNKVDNGGNHLEKVLKVLKAAGLSPPEDYIYRFPHQLSGGQRQRVAIARAMILEPSLLVADEPTSMLDASYAAQIFEILLDVRQRLGTTILFITHSLAAARYLCDRVGVIYRGNLMELGLAGEVIQTPGHPYTQALLDATPKFGRSGSIPRFNSLLAKRRFADPGSGCPFYHRCAMGQKDPCEFVYPDWTVISQDHMAACHLAAGRSGKTRSA